MPLPVPDLDDRRFDDLLAEAVRRLEQTCPEWTDRSPGDPGMALVELFAHLTEVMLYRLNRVPEKAYVEFLRLIGAKLHPPAAAVVTLRFARNVAGKEVIAIPRGTEAVASSAGQQLSFTTMHAAALGPNDPWVDVPAVQCETVEAELAATATGRPGQWIAVQRPPIIAATGDELDLMVAVERRDGDADGPSLRHEGIDYRVWREVASFADVGVDRLAYIADRSSGRITFAPALARDGRSVPLAEAPGLGRRIRIWYRRGGGTAGNLPAGAIRQLRTPIAGVQVSNPAAATGGRAGETLENALVRGPSEFGSLHRAVTARDFEALALRVNGGVARACACTEAAQWVHAERGTVGIILVPTLPPGSTPDAATLAAHQNEAVREAVLASCDERRALGTRCTVTWARTKSVRVQARVVVHREEDPAAVRQRILARLREGISPLPSERYPEGWPFGRPLRASHVYDIILAEPGVSYVDQVRLFQDDVPSAQVARLAVDRFQPQTWYAAASGGVFRSTNDGVGWELVRAAASSSMADVCASPRVPGLIAAVERDGGETTVVISRDCGETWQLAARTLFAIGQMAWLHRGDASCLLLAAAEGLFELRLAPGAVPVQILVDPRDPGLGFYAVAVGADAAGAPVVAAAARRQAGVYLSRGGGASGSWSPPGLAGEDVRALCVQQDGPRRFVWAGTAAPGDGQGTGCFVSELAGEAAATGWRAASAGWSGGSVRCLASDGVRVYAGSHRGGILAWDTAQREPSWRSPARGATGLPMRRDERDGLQPVDCLAVANDGTLVQAGGAEGVWRSPDARVWRASAARESVDLVTLPETWLFTSGAHDVRVAGDDAE